MTTIQTTKTSTTKTSSNNGAAKAAPKPAPKAAESKPAAKKAAKDAKLPLARRVQTKLMKQAKRWERTSKALGAWTPEVATAANEVGELLGSLIVLVANLPNDFAPAKKGGGGSTSKDVPVGATVRVTDKAKAKYTGILEESEYTDLKVLLIAQGKVRVKTASTGTIIMLPRAHVQVTAPPAPPSSSTAVAKEGKKS
jgi:multidrug efflux pump subunit AcrB